MYAIIKLRDKLILQKIVSLFFAKFEIIIIEKAVLVMSRSNYENGLYKMYEEQITKLDDANRKIKNQKLEIHNLKKDLRISENRIKTEIKKAVAPLIKENSDLQEKLNDALNEINRLKEQISNNANNTDKDYLIDKLNNQLSKDSTNSSIPTSKESIDASIKRRTNTYNHREPSNRKTGAQFNHEGKTLTKEKLEKKIKDNHLEVRTIKHYVNGKKYSDKIIKYEVGIEVKTYVNRHIFIPNKKSKAVLPNEYYSDVVYTKYLRSLVVILGNYFCLPYNKIRELISNISNSVINLSDGTIDNFYEDFSLKTEATILNITNNLMNGKYQHTDETVTRENGKDTYYRGYANGENVLYKYHYHKGDQPISEDGILNKYFGILITDHDKGMFKYGTNNQDCVVHFGRYCIEHDQNIVVTSWQMSLYRLLLKFERNRQILKKYDAKEFSASDISSMKKEYDDIIELGKEENRYITSTYWREKAETLLKRCIDYKEQMLFFLHDFSIPYDNNFIERALRMIKGKIKISGGFRSYLGGVRFGNIMSVIKTSKLRNINPFTSITSIMNGNSLFA